MNTHCPGSGIQRISTLGQRADQRFEYWRSLFGRIDLDVSHRDSLKNFRGEMLRCEGGGEWQFSYTAFDDTIAHFAKPESAFVMLSLPLSGRMRMRVGQEVTHSLRAGEGLLVMDGESSLVSSSESYSHLSLTVPRDEAAQILGDDMNLLGDGLIVRPLAGLAALLASHLQTMTKQGEALDVAGAEAAMRAAGELALGTLAQLRDEESFCRGDRHLGALHEASCRYIALNFAAHDLTATSVARALGCSRAHLYRAFEAQDRNLGDVIRRTRLDHAAGLLAAAPQLSIEQVAFRCGYGSAAAFARAFRSHTGMTASAYRDSRRDG